MATITICDVKVCGDVIKDGKPLHAMIAGIKYELCKKCFDGLQKFVDENLTKPNAEPPIQKLDQQSIDELIKEMQKSFEQTKQGLVSTQQSPFYTSPGLTYPAQWIFTNPGTYEFEKNPGIQYYSLSTGTADTSGQISITDVSKK